MKKNTKIYLLFFFASIFLNPIKTEAQLEIFLDFLIYDYGLLFGFEGEPGAHDIDYAAYPYEYPDRGMYLDVEESGFHTMTNINFQLQNNEDDVSGGFFQIKFSPVSIFTIDVNHLQLFEDIRNGEDRRYSFTNFSAQYNRVRNTRFHYWWSLGVTRAGGSEYDTQWGPSFGTGATFYIKRPISIYTDFRWTYFTGEYATVGTYEVRLQAHIKQFKIYAGLQYLDEDFNWASWSLGTGVYF